MMNGTLLNLTTTPAAPDTDPTRAPHRPETSRMLIVSRACGTDTRPVGVFAVDAGRVRFVPVYDPHRLTAYAVVAVGLLTGAVVSVMTRRRGPSIGSVRMGPGGWVSLKGAAVPPLLTDRDRPWWARLLRAHRLTLR